MIVEHLVTHPSLEISWLPNSITKGLVTPQIRYVSDVDYGGAYYKVQHHDNDWGNLKKRPIIDVDIGNDTPSTIAHEYKHHEQTYNKGGLVNLKWRVPKGSTYKAAIVHYFTHSWSEMDALLFECNIAPCETNMEWLRWIKQCRA